MCFQLRKILTQDNKSVIIENVDEWLPHAGVGVETAKSTKEVSGVMEMVRILIVVIITFV